LNSITAKIRTRSAGTAATVHTVFATGRVIWVYILNAVVALGLELARKTDTTAIYSTITFKTIQKAIHTKLRARRAFGQWIVITIYHIHGHTTEDNGLAIIMDTVVTVIANRTFTIGAHFTGSQPIKFTIHPAFAYCRIERVLILNAILTAEESFFFTWSATVDTDFLPAIHIVENTIETAWRAGVTVRSTTINELFFLVQDAIIAA
jgi:hypothetical protein